MKNKSKFGFLTIIAIIAGMLLLNTACDPGGGSDDDDHGIYTGQGAVVDGVSYEVGDEGPGGGIIFYVRPEGDPFTLYEDEDDTVGRPAYYLEAAPADISGGQQWASSIGNLIPGLSQNQHETTDKVLGRGLKNTAIIIAHGDANDYTTPAASACVDYRGPNDLSDWFLPSMHEHDLLRNFHVYITQNAEKYPGLTFGFNSGYYATSSQINSGLVWVRGMDMGGGSWIYLGPFASKTNTYNVRAIRAF